MAEPARLVFEQHAGGPEMDGRQFQKLCKVAGFHNFGFTGTDADLIFAKVKPAGGRRIDWPAFEDSCEEIAVRLRLSFDEVLDRVVEAGRTPLFNPPARGAGGGGTPHVPAVPLQLAGQVPQGGVPEVRGL